MKRNSEDELSSLTNYLCKRSCCTQHRERRKNEDKLEGADRAEAESGEQFAVFPHMVDARYSNRKVLMGRFQCGQRKE